MDLYVARKLAIELMDKHELLLSGWYFSFDNAKRRFGCCNYGLKQISLSKHLVSLNAEADVKNTIIHEIAHALVGFKHRHDRVWKAKAMEIGCTGDRCYSSKNVATPEAKYLLVCPNGHTAKRHKKPRYPKQQSCAKCCPVYDARYLLTWTLNPKN